MRRQLRWVAVSTALALLGCVLSVATADEPAMRSGPSDSAEGSAPKRSVREIYVPFSELNVILEQQPKRVLLTREQYNDLLAKAKKSPDEKAPLGALVVAADYQIDVRDQRGHIRGSLTLEVLNEGLQALPLDLSGVGLTSAMLDDRNAPIGRGGDGMITVFVEGKGRHKLELEMVTALETSAARQVLQFRLPRPPAATLQLTVPGDVEVKSGAEVIQREVDDRRRVTRFDLVAPAGDTALVMTLNSHLERQQRAVVARSVQIGEVTQAYERLHVTASLQVLYRAVDQLRFAVPEGFEILEVASPLLSRWDIEENGDARILNVRLREQTTETVQLQIAAIRTPTRMESWRFPQLEPLDVESHASIVGLLVEDRLQAQSMEHQRLIPIDVEVLRSALPESVLRYEPGQPRLRPVATFYAPQSAYQLSADFAKPAARLLVTTSVLLTLDDQGQSVRGGFTILPEVERRFSVDFQVPPEWFVSAVTTTDNRPLSFERYQDPSRIHVRLPDGVPAGQEFPIYFDARRTPEGWLAPWQSQSMELPIFAILGADRDEGAVAVSASDDIAVRPEKLVNLTPLDAGEKQQYGLEAADAALSYRYQGRDYSALLALSRTAPQLTARTFSFFQLKPDVLVAHYEVVFHVEEARTRSLAVLLPAGTPAAAQIRGLGAVAVKEFASEPAGELRRWNILLDDARRGDLHIAVDFEQPLEQPEPKGLVLPLIAAADVAYQTGLVSVEGAAELSIEVKTKARGVDVGELVDAQYQPGRHLLGAFGFAGDPPKVAVDVKRDPAYRLPPAVVERATLITHVAAEGSGQTEARFRLQTKVPVLELALPARAELWSAILDDVPLKPQREGNRVLINLPAQPTGSTRTLQIVYAAPVDPLLLSGRIDVDAPQLLVPLAEGQSLLVPLNEVSWELRVPQGFEVTRPGGTLVTDELDPPEPAAIAVLRDLFVWGPAIGAIQADREASRRASAEFAARLAEAEATDSADLPKPMEGRRAASEDDGLAAEGERAEGHIAVLEDQSRAASQPQATYTLPRATPPGADAFDTNGTIREMPPGQPAPAPQPQEPMAEEAKRGDGPARMGGQAAGPGTPAARAASMRGFSSLKIDLADDGTCGVTFRSLGAAPRLEVTLVNRERFELLGWGLGLLAFVVGVALTRAASGRKMTYVVAVAAAATLVPLLWQNEAVVWIGNCVFYAVALLVPYYLLAGLAIWSFNAGRACIRTRAQGAAPATAALATLLIALAATTNALAADERATIHAAADDGGALVIVSPPPPVSVPEDAIIVPYDTGEIGSIQDVRELLVPYERYVELWNQAHPEKKLTTVKPPAPYALAGAQYRTILMGDDYLTLLGEMEIEVFDEGHVQVPFSLSGGVLSRAEVDGRAAQLSLVLPEAAALNAPPAQQAAQVQMPPANQQAVAQAEFANAPAQPREGSLLLLHLQGRGKHKLSLEVRLQLERQGGWRVAQGSLPAAPATKVAVEVPDKETELRFQHVRDRQSYDQLAAGQTIETAVGADGRFGVRWRPVISEGQVDRSLTARSAVLFDVQEDGLRTIWRLTLEFRRSQRERFTLGLPAGYLVERVEGGNVRGWQMKTAPQGQSLEVELLKPAIDQEEFVLHLVRSGSVGQGELATFALPIVSVRDAALSSGEITIRRSPLLELRTTQRAGVTRTDLGGPSLQLAELSATPNALGIRPFQSYRFATTPFDLQLAAAPIEAKVSARVQSILKIADYVRTLESRVLLTIDERPIHRVEIWLPEDFRLDRVSAPGEFQRAVTDVAGRSLLTLYLAAAQQGQAEILLEGALGEDGPIEKLEVPRLEVNGVERQTGEIAVQLDPAFNVELLNANGIEGIPLGRVGNWLNPEQRRALRLALEYRQPVYDGTLVLSTRRADVSAETITNVSLTMHAVRETVYLDYQVANAGVRKLAFTLPEWMNGARVRAPMLRQKSVETADGRARFLLEFQDELMGNLKIVVENDRLLVHDREYQAPIPALESARVRRQYVVLENVGRDEMETVGTPAELQRINPESTEWQALMRRLGGGRITQAFVVTPDARQPKLVFKTQQREVVKTAGARIGLAETELMIDSQGAYRARQVYRLDNSTEQFLVVRLPERASLWTAVVAGAPVKPVRDPTAKDDRLVMIPLVKTAEGDLDYAVELRYGGMMDSVGWFDSVRFPLMRAVNIEPQTSQVKLYVPKGYRWVRFEGTMRMVREEGDLAAGYVAYQSKVAQKLLETMQHGDDFAKVRASANLKALKLRVQSGEVPTDIQNYKLKSELNFNNDILARAEEAAVQVQQTAEQAVEYDNRGLLNYSYEQQRVARSRNTVQDLGGNWFRVAPTSEAAAPADKPAALAEQVDFDDRWIAANALEQGARDEREALLRSQSEMAGAEVEVRRLKELDESNVIFDRKAQDLGAKQPANPKIVAGKGPAMSAGGREFVPANESGSANGEKAAEQSQVSRYQQRLLEQQLPQLRGEVAFGRGGQAAQLEQRQGQTGQYANQPMAGDGGVAFYSDQLPPRQYGGLDPNVVLGADIEQVRQDATGTARAPQDYLQKNAAIAAAPTGLASLEVAMPAADDLYEVYRFTTPRGEVEITAWGVSERVIATLWKLLMAVVAIGLLWLAIYLACGAWTLGPRVGAALLIAGFLIFVLALPWIGLAMIVVGATALLRYAFALARTRPEPVAAA